MIDKEENILISIIMPVYNSQRYLEAAINSVIAQTYSYFELLLIDDGSTDRSGEICDEFEKKDDRIKAFHKQNAGVCSARNYGIDIAKGRYICFIDNDDIYDKRYLEVMINKSNKVYYDIIKCGRKNIRITPESIEIKKTEFFFDESRSYTIKEFMDDYYKIKKTECFNSIWNGLYSLDFLKQNNITFDENIKYGNEDLIFNYLTLQHGPRIFVVKEILYTHYYRVSHSTSTRYYSNQIDTRIKAIRLEDTILYKYKNDIDNSLIKFEQLRECFKILAQCKEKKERDKQVLNIYREIYQKCDFKSISYYKLNKVQKLDYIIFKHKWFKLYFLYKNIQRYVES